MSELLELKYEEGNGFRATLTYVILERSEKASKLLYMINGKPFEVDVTDRVDEFCRTLNHINAASWHNKKYKPFMDYFPSWWWSLKVKTDEMTSYCEGTDCYPPKWNSFAYLLRKSGIPIEKADRASVRQK